MRRQISVLSPTGESRQKLVIPSAKILNSLDPASNADYTEGALNVYMRSKTTRKGDYRTWTQWGPWPCGDDTCVVLWGYTSGTTPHVVQWCLDGEEYCLFDDAIIARFSGEHECPLLANLEDVTDEHVGCVRAMCTPGHVAGSASHSSSTTCSSTAETSSSTITDGAVTTADLLCYESYTYPQAIEWAYPNADAMT